MDKFQLTGRTNSHVKVDNTLDLVAEAETSAAFSALKTAAAKEGIRLKAYSSFRNFNAQLEIWNKKYTGQRTLYDPQGKPLDYPSLSIKDRIYAILTWSALPGASRHHWGTDIDVIDEAALPDHYQVQLLPHEFAAEGIFYRLQQWLQENMARYGFFKPYHYFKGGVSAEPWHISYAPLAKKLLGEITPEIVLEAISEGNLLGGEIVREMLPEIFKTYVLNICE